METNITKVYVVKEIYCLYGDTKNDIIGIYASLDKAQVAYEKIKDEAERDLKPKESWYKDETTTSTDMYYELMDDLNMPEVHYQLELEEMPLL